MSFSISWFAEVFNYSAYPWRPNGCNYSVWRNQQIPTPFFVIILSLQATGSKRTIGFSGLMLYIQGKVKNTYLALPLSIRPLKAFRWNSSLHFVAIQIRSLRGTIFVIARYEAIPSQTCKRKIAAQCQPQFLAIARNDLFENFIKYWIVPTIQPQYLGWDKEDGMSVLFRIIMCGFRRKFYFLNIKNNITSFFWYIKPIFNISNFSVTRALFLLRNSRIIWPIVQFISSFSLMQSTFSQNKRTMDGNDDALDTFKISRNFVVPTGITSITTASWVGGGACTLSGCHQYNYAHSSLCSYFCRSYSTGRRCWWCQR